MTYASLKLSALLEAKNFLETINFLIEAKKKYYPTLNQSTLAKKLNFSSRSVMSNYLNGRRNFPESKINELAKILSLTTQERFLLELMYKKDQAKIEEKNDLEARISVAKDIIRRINFFSSSPFKDSILSADIYLVLESLSFHPTIHDLQNMFLSAPKNEIDENLKLLIEAGFIIEENETLKIVQNKKNYTPENIDQRKFSNNLFAATSKEIQEWYKKNDKAIFGVSLLSCDFDEYLKKINEFEALWEEFILDLESDSNLDTILHLNFAFNIVGIKKKP